MSSPFDAFDRYERERGVPPGLIRSVNATNPDSNAWALLERSEIDSAEFDRLFAQESAELGHRVPGADVLALLAGEVRPEMVDMLDRVIAAGYRTACLTNNVVSADPRATRTDVQDVMERFEHVIESSKVGVRKPEVRFYEIACDTVGVQPHECVFLDDLGINLKPAKAMGMTTIKVTDPAAAIAELTSVLDL